VKNALDAVDNERMTTCVYCLEKERRREEEMGREIHFSFCVCDTRHWNPIETRTRKRNGEK
jgi:hypothetical protein